MTLKEFKKIVHDLGYSDSNEEDVFLIVDDDNAEVFEYWLTMYTHTSKGLWLTYSMGKAHNSEKWVIHLWY